MNIGKLCFIKKLMEILLSGKYQVMSFPFCIVQYMNTCGVQGVAAVHELLRFFFFFYFEMTAVVMVLIDN